MASRAAPLVDFRLLCLLARTHYTFSMGPHLWRVLPRKPFHLPLPTSCCWQTRSSSILGLLTRPLGGAFAPSLPPPFLMCNGSTSSRPPMETFGKKSTFLTPFSFPRTLINLARCFWSWPCASGHRDPTSFSSVQGRSPRRCWTWPPSPASIPMVLFSL